MEVNAVVTWPSSRFDLATNGLSGAPKKRSFIWGILGIVLFEILFPNGSHEFVQLYFLIVYNRGTLASSLV